MAATPSAENITILCGLATLSFLTDVNEWSTENEPRYYRVNAGQVNAVFRYLEDNGTMEWLTSVVKTGANRAKHVANLKKGGAIGAVMDKTHAIRSLLDSFVTKKNPSLAGVRAEVRNWTGWSRAFTTILDEEDFDYKSMAALMRTFRSLKPNVTSPDGRKMFATLAREPLMNDKGNVHKDNPEDDSDETPAPEPTPEPKPEPEKPKAPEPTKSKTTEPARTRVVQKGDDWTIMNGSDTLGWKQLAVVKDRPSAVAFLKGMGMNAVTADALASVIQAKKPEPAAKDRPKKSEAPSGTPLTPEKIQKTYGLDPNQSKVVAADAEEQVVSAAAGSGKCLGLGTPVMLFDGRVIAVENVKVGDRLMGPDSKPRVVQSVTQGKGMLYQITPVKGDPWVCNDVHVLTLAGTNRRNGQIRDIPLNEFQKLGKNERQKDWKLFRVGVEYKARPTPIDPYFLGLWIGDGTTTASVITNMEPEIREFCAEYAERLGMFCEQTYVPRVNAWTIAFTAKKGRKSPAAPNHLRQYLRLCCCARNNAKRKIIPEKFMVNSREVRLQLLAGIIDTDGYYHRGCYEIASKWSQLAWQIKQLAASLGFGVNYSCKVVNGTTYYRVNICGEGLEKIPVRVPRKKAEKRRQIKRATVTGFSVDPIGVGDYYGFTLDGDGRFLLGDFTVTHNTSTTVRKIEYLVNQLGVDPSSIKVMAFNKHAAREVKSRLAQNIGLEKANQVYPQTTHGFCLSEMKAWSPFHKEGCGALVTGSSMPWDGKYLTPGPMLVRQAWEEALKRLGYMTKRSDGGWKRPRKDDIGVDIGTLKRWIGKSKNEGMTLTDFMASEWERREDQRVQILMAGLLLYEDQKGMLDREKERGDSRTEEYVDYFLPPAGSGDAESGDWDTKLRKALGRLEGNEGVSVRFDFDDMLNEFYLGITELPTDNDRAKAAKRERVEKLREDFKYWMVDEAQDLAPVQHKIFNTVARERDGDGQYILIGDPDQSIYGFRGATPESFVDAEKTSESMSIPINYRSRKEIVELADKLVGENKLRIARANVANRPAGGTVKAYSLKDYESISTYVAGDIVGKLGNGGYLNERGTPRFSIICRTNKELDMFEDELAIRGITYVRRGGRPFWLKDDVGATTALMALAYHIAGKMKLEPKEQLEYLGRAFKFPNRPGAPGASSGQSGKFYLKPVANSNDPIGTLLSVSAGDISGRPGTGDAVVAFAKDIKSVAAAVKDGPTGMFRAMLGMESKGYDGQTFGDLMIEASVRSEDDSELQDTAGEAGGDDPVEGVSAFSKLFRFYEYNKFTSPEQFVQACVESTNRSAVMQAKVIAKKDDANLEAVNLSTIHMTKGLEYENVYTVMNQGKFPSNVFPTDDLLANRDRLAKYDGGDNEEKLKNMKLEEERRLAYVAITRATESFTAFASETDLKGQPAEKSQFLSEMGLTPETIEIDESVKAAVDSHMADVLRSL